MSFITEIKNEIYERTLKNDLIKYRFAGVLFSCGSIILQGSQPSCLFVTTSRKLSSHAGEMVEKLFNFPLSAFCDSNKYVCEIDGKNVKKVASELGLENTASFIEALNVPQLKEFASGVFLASAKSAISIEGRGSGYHIEFVFENIQNAKIFCDILASYEILPKLIDRKGSIVIYIKSSDCICNLLALIGAGKSMMALSNEIAARAVRNSVNRKTNCDTYNIGKQIEAAKQQVEAIRTLQVNRKLESLDKKLQETAEVRLQYPESTYEELAKILGLTKSGVVHRLDKILKIAD